MDVKWVRTRLFRSVLVSVLGLAVALPCAEPVEGTAILPLSVSTSLPAELPARAAALPQPSAVRPSSVSRVPDYLQSAGFPQAWKMLRRDVTSVIAVLDTGVDLTHPSLKPYLTGGINLIEPGKPANDENGHGTAVAGVIAAALSAGAGDSSVHARWRGRIMPVKALDAGGTGDQQKLTQGIRSAVQRGADIIVLSLGLRRDEPGLREAVAWADRQGVLLVAATGNDAASFGAKAAVQFPAAYPEVLAVAGSDGLKDEPKSTGGPEVDLSAAWQVETLAVGGLRTVMQGTSMGAPQVAAAAAMLKAVHPDWTPFRLREALRQSAESAAAPGWDARTGYGYLRADRALAAGHVPDWRNQAHDGHKDSVFPLGKEVAGKWSRSQTGSFAVNIPYDGTYTVSGEQETRWAGRLSLYDNKGVKIPPLEAAAGSSDVRWRTSKGEYRLQVEPDSRSGVTEADYRLMSKLQIAQDSMEPNDNPLSAFTLAARTQSWTGTFHTTGDEDWSVVTLPRDGTLRVKVETDTTRIDPALTVQPVGGTPLIQDEGGEGEPEELVLRDVKAGKYYIRVTNAVSAHPAPVLGTYKVALEYINQYEDPNEPNGVALLATTVSPGKVYEGGVAPDGDVDWFRFSISGKRELTVRVTRTANKVPLSVSLRNNKFTILKIWDQAPGRKQTIDTSTLMPGTYYLAVRAQGSGGVPHYSLDLRAAPASMHKIANSGQRAAETIPDAVWANRAATVRAGVLESERSGISSAAIGLLLQTARILRAELAAVWAQMIHSQGA